MPLRKPLTPENAIVRLEALCARSERSSFELIEKLKTWGISSDNIQQIIKRLKDNRFCDDHRFALAFTADKFEFAKWGRRKIAAALYAKRLPSDIINEALQSIDSKQYLNTLSELALAKIQTLLSSSSCPPEDTSPEDITRIARSLAARGFEPNLIFPTLRNVLASLSNDLS